MSGVGSFLRASAIGGLALALLTVLAIEGVCWWKDATLRGPLYLGAAAGFGINVLGFPFILKMAALTPAQVREGAQWNWWLYSALARTAGIGLFAAVMSRWPSGHEAPTVLAGMAVYMAGLCAELAWLARRYNAVDKR